MCDRKFFVVGNFKMNGSRSSLSDIVANLNKINCPNTDVVVAPPSIYLQYVSGAITNQVKVAAQNCYKMQNGAYTGEISPDMLKDMGIEWVFLGHLERRHLFNESNELIGQKVKLAVESGINVILCVGEKLDEREAGVTEKVIFGQMKMIKNNVCEWKGVVIAYEALWATESGKSATPDQVQEVHACIRKWLAINVSDKVATSTRIIYGGSVNAGNCKDLANCKDIDGLLVGAASLKPEFTDIVKANNA